MIIFILEHKNNNLTRANTWLTTLAIDIYQSGSWCNNISDRYKHETWTTFGLKKKMMLQQMVINIERITFIN